MKISLFVIEDAIQLNLTPESQHESDFMRLLDKYNGAATISHGVEVIETMGNYLRNSPDDKTVAITIHKKMVA